MFLEFNRMAKLSFPIRLGKHDAKLSKISCQLLVFQKIVKTYSHRPKPTKNTAFLVGFCVFLSSN